MDFLSLELQDELKKEAVQAEKTGKLTRRQLEIIYSRKLFNIFVPKVLGGLELELMEGLYLEEKLAKIDGSLGWTVTLCSGANAFVGYLPQDTVQDIFRNPEVCLGGSGKIGGIAQETENGYIVNGEWKYVTGAPHTTVFTANCQIEKEGEKLINTDGSPVYKSFFFLPQEVTVIEDWHTIGLIATASHSYQVKNLKVDKKRSFVIESGARTLDQLIYQYPFLTFAELTLAVNHLGIQQHFLELASFIFARIKEAKHKEFRTQLLKNAEKDILDRRTLFFSHAENSWKELKDQGKVSEELAVKISRICREIVKEGRETALQVYPYLGVIASDPGTEVNRVLRDMLTASQHSLLL
jgi:alkylation response protein AidB-like acyl-CoA dehydrogenase